MTDSIRGRRGRPEPTADEGHGPPAAPDLDAVRARPSWSEDGAAGLRTSVLRDGSSGAVVRARASGSDAHGLREHPHVRREAGSATADQARATQDGRAERARSRGDLELQVQQLTTALETRPRIDMALGMVMVALGCDDAVAWAALSGLSQRSNRKVRDLADRLVAEAASGTLDIAALRALLRPLPAGRAGRRGQVRSGRVGSAAWVSR